MDNDRSQNSGIPFNMSYDTYQGSIQQVLRDNVGQYVEIEFLIGSENITTRYGVLKSVGSNYIIIQNITSKRNTICDIFAIKFVTVYDPTQANLEQFEREAQSSSKS